MNTHTGVTPGAYSAEPRNPGPGNFGPGNFPGNGATTSNGGATETPQSAPEQQGLVADFREYVAAELCLHSTALSACADYFVKGLVSTILAALLVVGAVIVGALGLLLGIMQLVGEGPLWVTLLSLAGGLALLAFVALLVSKWFVAQGKSVLSFVMSHWGAAQ